ncbi:DNA methyltransferase [Pseudomonas sp. NPDC089569]|uniref:DNA methyltransferase n=1 Tax=Pseudomonas sp. NPDC089569 TaxID=3390722 RepID=UPI003D05EAD7
MKSFKAKSSPTSQGDLFGIEQVANLYKGNPNTPLKNADLYRLLSKQRGLDSGVDDIREPVGSSGQKHNLAHRSARWCQQSLKHMGIIERIPGTRGVWGLTEQAKRELNAAKPGVKVLGFRTDLGVAIFGPSGDIFKNMRIPVTLCLTSPPYPLAKSRRYGNPDEREIVNFILETLTPIIENLTEDGSLCINTSQDVFMPGSPARSTYIERLILAICDTFNLSLMERAIWSNPSKAPGPVQWASKSRQQLNVGYEPILIFAKNPHLVKADNRRVLEPHTDRHLKLIANGGERREASYSDGAYRLRVGSFGGETAGRIPKNVITRGHRCAYGLQYQKAATALGLPVHGAGQPLSIADFLIRFLSDEQDLVVDPFGGRMMTGLAAEMLNRTWMCGELNLQYVRGGAELFRDKPGFHLNPDIERAFAK